MRPWERIIPSVGWKAKLDFEFPNKRSQTMRPKINQIIPLIPLILRYLVYRIRLWWRGRTPVMDFLHTLENKETSGVPLGGIGGGSIGRGFRGEFCNYQMMPGMYEYNVIDANQFIVTIRDAGGTQYQKVLSVKKKPPKVLKSWDWTFPGSQAEYTALYPRAWTVYNIEEQKIKLTCRQVSPVIPHNYTDSSMPVAVFEWKIENYSGEKKDVSLTFTFKNGTGGKADKKGGVKSKLFERSGNNRSCEGVTIFQSINSNPYTYSIALDSVCQPSRCTYFNPKSNGETIWESLKKDGSLINCEKEEFTTRNGEELACAVCGKVSVENETYSVLVFSLAWDMPQFRFTPGGVLHTRYYTKFFGSSGDAGPDMCQYALDHYKTWEIEIYNWQQKYLDDGALPDWYKSALLNELYYVADGGTIWVLANDDPKLPPEDPRVAYGRSAYLEGHEYRMYNTYDVHFYASFALTMLWPKLQECLQYDFRDSIDRLDSTQVWYLYDGKCADRKSQYSVPHDLGDPDEDPFKLINAYPIHDVAEWRDLNLKFVLQVYRDYSISNDYGYVEAMFPQVLTVMSRSLEWDTDNDGMIENSGAPDQTYDAWTMTGTSAYCGGLWLAAVYVTVCMSTILQKGSLVAKYNKILDKAKESFIRKLWNGQYYNFDCSGGRHSASIMADQLCGLWYLHSSKVTEEVFPANHVGSALNTIYDFNVKRYFSGSQGAVNGMMPDGRVDSFAVQSEEVWTGVTYALASLLIYEGKKEEGFTTARGIYETVYEKSGLGFATPEALHGSDGFRSLGYMRPLSIWSMQMAIEAKAKSPRT